MRCSCCNEVLNDFESTRRKMNTHQYIDLCNKCFRESYAPTYPVSERKDLMTSEDFEDDLDTEGTDEILYNNYRVLLSIEDIED